MYEVPVMDVIDSISDWISVALGAVTNKEEAWTISVSAVFTKYTSFVAASLNKEQLNPVTTWSILSN